MQALREQFQWIRRLPGVAADPSDYHQLLVDIGYKFLRRKEFSVALNPCCSVFWDSVAKDEVFGVPYSLALALIRWHRGAPCDAVTEG